MALSQFDNSFILVLVISLMCSLLLAFVSALLSMTSKSEFRIDRIFTSMPHLLFINITLIILISSADYDIVTTLYSIPFGTMNSVIFILIYCILSSLLSHSTKNHLIHHSIIISISFIIWLLLSFILSRIIQLFLSNYPNFMIFEIHFSTIIVLGVICAFFQFLIASSIFLANLGEIEQINDINDIREVIIGHKTYIIRGIFALIINGLCIWMLTVNQYSILCGIICVFPSLHLSLNKLPLRDTVIMYLLQSSSLNIFGLLVARFYFMSNIPIWLSLLLSYTITIFCFVVPIHFCLIKTMNHKTHKLSYGSIEFDNRDIDSFSSLGDL